MRYDTVLISAVVYTVYKLICPDFMLCNDNVTECNGFNGIDYFDVSRYSSQFRLEYQKHRNSNTSLMFNMKLHLFFSLFVTNFS